MATKKQAAKAKVNNEKTLSAETDVDNVDKIRDILFGNQMREMNLKHGQLEQRLANDIESLRKENTRQIESLQTFIESEIEILANKLSHSEKNQIAAIDDLDGDLQKSIKQFDKKLNDTHAKMDTQSQETNQKILKQSKDFTKEMNQQIEDTRKRMDEFRQELETGKVDKSILAEMLNTMALQINGDGMD